MNLFCFLALLGGFGAIGSFLLGSRVTSRYSYREVAASGWSWEGVFTTLVFLTILAAPLSH